MSFLTKPSGSVNSRCDSYSLSEDSPSGSILVHSRRLVCVQIPIRGGDGSWRYRGVASLRGKQPHIASAVEELSHCYLAQIDRRSTLLIDDDARNISDALNSGVNAILYSPTDPCCIERGISALLNCVG